MSPEVSTLLQLFRSAGVIWVVERNPEVRGNAYLSEIRDVEAEYHRRYGITLDLLEVCSADMDRMAAFIQSFAVSMSCSIRTMIVRILDGAAIAEIRYEYQEKRSSRLFVRLSDPNQDRGEADQFESDELWDVNVFRHFAPVKMGDRPLLIGYSALRSY